jgi:hypothetical protein
MKKFKLIKEYPGSPKLGQIALPYTDSKNAVAHYIVDRNDKKDCNFIALSKKWVENQPEYWEEVLSVNEMMAKTKSISEAVELLEKISIQFANWSMSANVTKNAEQYFHFSDKDMFDAFKKENGYS